MRLHYFRRIGTSETPYHVACRVSYMRADRMRAQINVVYESAFEYGDEASQPFRQQEASAAELRKRKTAAVPN